MEDQLVATTKIFVCKCGGVGDVIFTTPVLEALKRQYPNSVITLLTFPNAVEIVKGLPFIDEIIPLDKSWQGTLSLIRKIWKYDLALLLDIQYRPAWISFLAQIPVRAGNRYKRGKWLTHSSDEDPNLLSIYEPYNIANIIKRTIGLDLTQIGNLDRLMIAPISLADEHEAKRIMLNCGYDQNLPYVVLAPYTAWAPKDWPLEYYRELADKIRLKGYQVVIIGTNSQRERCGEWDGVINVMGLTTLMMTAAIIKHAVVVVGGCSAPIHIAAAVDTPTIGLYGPTMAERGAPKHQNIALSAQLNCRPCDGRVANCEHKTCMYQITPEEVFNACCNFLNL